MKEVIFYQANDGSIFQDKETCQNYETALEQKAAKRRAMTKEKLEENKKKIIGWCRGLACSQGFYGRVLRDLMEEPSTLEELAYEDFGTQMDFILYMEE